MPTSPLSPDEERRVREVVRDETKRLRGDVLSEVDQMNRAAVAHVERVVGAVASELAIVKRQGAVTLQELCENTTATKAAANELVANREERLRRAGREEAEAAAKAKAKEDREVDQLAQERKQRWRLAILGGIITLIVALIGLASAAAFSHLPHPGIVEPGIGSHE